MSRGVAVLLASGLLAAWLFFQVFQSHQAATRLNEAEMRRNRAEFDSDFARAFGVPKPQLDQLDQRAAEAAKALTAEQAKFKAAQAVIDSKMHSVGGQVDQALEQQLRQ